MQLYILNMEDSGFAKKLQTISSSCSSKRHFIRKSYSEKAMAVCISEDNDCSIDVEERRVRSEESIRYYLEKFTSFNMNYKAEDVNLEWFYKAWTAMESYFKLTGLGFNADKDFTLDLESKSIYRGNSVVAYVEFVDFRNYLICLCSEVKSSMQNVKVISFGWGDGDN